MWPWIQVCIIWAFRTFYWKTNCDLLGDREMPSDQGFALMFLFFQSLVYQTHFFFAPMLKYWLIHPLPPQLFNLPHAKRGRYPGTEALRKKVPGVLSVQEVTDIKTKKKTYHTIHGAKSYMVRILFESGHFQISIFFLRWQKKNEGEWWKCFPSFLSEIKF